MKGKSKTQPAQMAGSEGERFTVEPGLCGHQGDMPQRPYYPGVRIKRALRENVRNTCFIDIKTKADSFTNQGSVEVCGKAVNRGGGLGMEIPCVHIFDCPRKHVDLLEQLLDRRQQQPSNTSGG